MRRFFLYTALFLFSTGLYAYYKSNCHDGNYSEELFTIASTGIFGSLGALFGFIVENRNAILLSIRCQLYKRNESVYVSLSYLFRIKITGENKYLMVRGSKIKNQYQPVGGVYKRFPSLDEKWRNWDARASKNDPRNADDLRFETKRKNIPAVRRWFYRRLNREVCVWREFYEELVSTGILSAERFTHIKPEYLYSIEETLISRKGKSTKQFLIYDIFTIQMDDAQSDAVRDLLNSRAFDREFAFVDEADLDKELFLVKGEEQLLGYHARHLINKI